MNSDNPRPKVTIDDIYAAADRLKSAQLDGQNGPERQALRDMIDAFLAPYEPPSWLIGVLRTVPQITAQFETVDSGTHDCWVDDEQAPELWTPLPAPPAVPEWQPITSVPTDGQWIRGRTLTGTIIDKLRFTALGHWWWEPAGKEIYRPGAPPPR